MRATSGVHVQPAGAIAAERDDLLEQRRAAGRGLVRTLASASEPAGGAAARCVDRLGPGPAALQRRSPTKIAGGAADTAEPEAQQAARRGARASCEASARLRHRGQPALRRAGTRAAGSSPWSSGGLSKTSRPSCKQLRRASRGRGRDRPAGPAARPRRGSRPGCWPPGAGDVLLAADPVLGRRRVTRCCPTSPSEDVAVRRAAAADAARWPAGCSRAARRRHRRVAGRHRTATRPDRALGELPGERRGAPSSWRCCPAPTTCPAPRCSTWSP